MEKNALPDDATMERLRQDGKLICECTYPDTEFIWLFSTFQCKTCGGPIGRP